VKTILLAVGFMAVFEGLMPLLAPQAWLEALRRLSDLKAERVRPVAFVVVSLALAYIWALMEWM